jgi:hypothetical protein
MCYYHDEKDSVPTKAILPVVMHFVPTKAILSVVHHSNLTGNIPGNRYFSGTETCVVHTSIACIWKDCFGSTCSSEYCQNTRCSGRGISLPTDLSQQLRYYRYLHLHSVLSRRLLLSTWSFIFMLLL